MNRKAYDAVVIGGGVSCGPGDNLCGDATKILKLTPLLRRFAEAYNQVLREMGKESIILS